MLCNNSSKAQVVGVEVGDIAPEIELPDTKGNNRFPFFIKRRFSVS